MGYRRLSTGEWFVDVSKQGFRRRITLPVSTTEDDAKIQEARFIEEHKKWLSKKEGSFSISTAKEVLEWWREQPLKSGKERSLDGAESRFNALINHLGGTELHELYGALMEFTKGLKSKGMKPATINRHIAIIKAAVHTAYDFRVGADWHRLIPENYLSGFPCLPENNIRHRILTPDERDSLYNELSEELRPLFFHASYYPCRKEEITMVPKTDVHLFKMKIWLPEDRSKTGRGRWIPIPPESKSFVIEAMNNSSNWLYSRRTAGRDWAPITNFRTAWEGACTRAGIVGYNWHKTRQQAAMELLYDGWDALDVMHAGGWKSMASFKRYIDIDEVRIDIKQGLFKPDLSWRKRHAPLTHRDKDAEVSPD